MMKNIHLPSSKIYLSNVKIHGTKNNWIDFGVGTNLCFASLIGKYDDKLNESSQALFFQLDISFIVVSTLFFYVALLSILFSFYPRDIEMSPCIEHLDLDI